MRNSGNQRTRRTPSGNGLARRIATVIQSLRRRHGDGGRTVAERDPKQDGPGDPPLPDPNQFEMFGDEAAPEDSPVVDAGTGPGARSGAVVSANGLTIRPEGARRIVGLGQAEHGTVVVNNDGTITYRPVPGYAGADAFAYEFEDEAGERMRARVQLDVAAQAEASAPPEPEADAPKVVGLTDGAHGTVRMDDRGAVIYRPAAGFAGSDRFTYTLRNPDGSEEVHTVLVRVDDEGRATLAVERGSHAAEGLGASAAAE